jgi:hypothetical protein
MYAASSNGSAIKVIAAILGILFVVATAGAVYFANEAQMNADCDDNYKELLATYNELSSSYSVALSEKQTLQNQVDSLNAQITSLSSQLEELRTSSTDKDEEIASLETQVDALSEDLAEAESDLHTKTLRVTYLETLIDSYEERNTELENQLEACLADHEELCGLTPYIGNFWTSPSNYVSLAPDEDDIAVKEYYIYLCVGCSSCDVCSYNPCDPCGICDPVCCDYDGPWEKIRLTVRVTTDFTVGDESQKLEIVSWKWV